MPLGPEQGPSDFQYVLSFTHPDLGPEGSTIPFRLVYDLSSDSTEAEGDIMIQKLVDMIENSDFNLSGPASKLYLMSRPIYPTT